MCVPKRITEIEVTVPGRNHIESEYRYPGRIRPSTPRTPTTNVVAKNKGLKKIYFIKIHE